MSERSFCCHVITKWAGFTRTQIKFECNVFGLLLTAHSDSPNIGVGKEKGSHDLWMDLYSPQLHNYIPCNSIRWKIKFPNLSEHQISVCSVSRFEERFFFLIFARPWNNTVIFTWERKNSLHATQKKTCLFSVISKWWIIGGLPHLFHCTWDVLCSYISCLAISRPNFATQMPVEKLSVEECSVQCSAFVAVP